MTSERTTVWGRMVDGLRPGRPSWRDLVAAVSVATILIPQSMAYAELAGLPAHVGLFAAAVAPLAAAWVVSSPWVQTGPVALTALLTFGALADRAEPGSDEYIRLAALLAVVVGVARVGFGLARLGPLAYLMSEPVLLGFTSGAAVLIAASLLPTAVAVMPPDGGVLWQAAWTLGHPGDWEPAALGFCALTFALMALGRTSPRVPGVLVAAVAGVVISRAIGYGGPIVGTVPSSLPEPSLDLPWSETPGLLLAGVVIAVVGFAEAASIARVFAATERRRWSPNQEFVSQGVANLASGLVGSLPVGCSFSRSAVSHQAGARTRWAGALSGLIVLAFLPVAGVVERLPRAILGAIVIGAVVGLIRPRAIHRMATESPPQAGVAVATFLATLAFSPRVERAVVLGVGLAIVVHLWREVQISVDHRIDGDVVTIEPRGVFWFGMAHRLEQMVVSLLGQHPQMTTMIMDLRGIGRIDYTAATVLRRIVDNAEASELEMEIRNIPPQARRILVAQLGGRAGVPER